MRASLNEPRDIVMRALGRAFAQFFLILAVYGALYALWAALP